MSVSPPRPKGPPLNALRAFEAAARLGGFAAAAEELNVTSGAISQHIKTVEDWAGTPLFERRAQGVRLTRAGAAIAPGLAAAFDRLGEATRGLRALRPDPVLQIAALPSVAQLWLGPRLPALRAALPDLRLSVTALERPPNLNRDMFDLSLFIGRPTGHSTETVLAHDALLPVCAPVTAGQIGSPDDLNHVTRLHDATWEGDWRRWSEATGCHLVNPDEGPRYSLYAMALDEARLGAGVLMGHRILVARALTDGGLVRACDGEVETGAALICKTTDPSDEVAALVTALQSVV